MKAPNDVTNPSDLTALFGAVEKINHRLDKLEGKSIDVARSPSNHPSLDKFQVAEAIVDSIFSHYNREKACSFEPSKPCDHCSMCNSRGF